MADGSLGCSSSVSSLTSLTLEQTSSLTLEQRKRIANSKQLAVEKLKIQKMRKNGGQCSYK